MTAAAVPTCDPSPKSDLSIYRPPVFKYQESVHILGIKGPDLTVPHRTSHWSRGNCPDVFATLLPSQPSWPVHHTLGKGPFSAVVAETVGLPQTHGVGWSRLAHCSLDCQVAPATPVLGGRYKLSSQVAVLKSCSPLASSVTAGDLLLPQRLFPQLE